MLIKDKKSEKFSDYCGGAETDSLPSGLTLDFYGLKYCNDSVLSLRLYAELKINKC